MIEDVILPILLGYAEGKKPNDFLFPFLAHRSSSLSGNELRKKAKNSICYADELLKEVADVLGIGKPVAMHSARHTFADMLLEETGDVRLVQATLDHSRLATTERYFSRNSKQGLADKANSLYKRQAQVARIDGTTMINPEAIPTETLLKQTVKTSEKKRFTKIA